MKIIFTSSMKLIPKKTQKNYTPNSYVLVFLISVIWFILLTIWNRGSMSSSATLWPKKDISGITFTQTSRVKFNKRRRWCFSPSNYTNPLLNLCLWQLLTFYLKNHTWDITRKIDVPEPERPFHCKMKLNFIWIVKSKIFLVIRKWTRECTNQPLYHVVSFLSIKKFSPCIESSYHPLRLYTINKTQTSPHKAGSAKWTKLCHNVLSCIKFKDIPYTYTAHNG